MKSSDNDNIGLRQPRTQDLLCLRELRYKDQKGAKVQLTT